MLSTKVASEDLGGLDEPSSPLPFPANEPTDELFHGNTGPTRLTLQPGFVTRTDTADCNR